MHSCPSAYVIRHFNRAINFSQNELALPKFESSQLENYLSDSLENFSESIQYTIQYTNQFGFRKGHSTEQAILEITDTLKLAIDRKQFTCGIFPDFSKAFDTVNHDILLIKLQAYGIRGQTLEWFASYLDGAPNT